MTTVADFVKDTLGLLGVVDPRQSVQPDDFATALRFLNRLCTRLEANGLAMGWADVDNPSDTLPLPPEAELGVMYNLAVMLAPQYTVNVSGEVAAGAEAFLAALRRDQAVATPIQQIVDVPTPGAWVRPSRSAWEG